MNRKLIYLIQTDTTVGFASRDQERLADIKKRPSEKKFLRTFASLEAIKNECRVPKQARKRVRRAKKTTFAYSDGYARRVVHDGEYHDFLKRTGWMYSTSANLSGEEFSKEWAEDVCDAIVYTEKEFQAVSSSSIFRLSKTKIKKVR